MEILQTARDAGRGLGVTLWAMVQDLGQLEAHYGKDGAKGWIESTRIRTFLGVSHPETAEFLSRALGQTTVETVSASANRNASGSLGDLWGHSSFGRTINRSHVGRPLMTPDEIMRMDLTPNGQVNEQIVLVRGMRPIRCGVAYYWRRPEFNAFIP
jgi:type IV secretion system protein VirD4